MQPSPYLRLESVSKKYYIREPRFGGRAARAAMPSWLHERRRELWALRDINFELHPGQTLGVIGLNGSGKSTLLKLLAGVSEPTGGRIESRGSVVGLLELGAGFHPDLTGYQNVYLQGNLMGLRKAEIDRKIGEIVEFSGLGDFMEWPVKRYSSGMYARLGFSVAVLSGARIVLIDEILAVGDAEFQRRGLARLAEIRRKGESIVVLVTHNVEWANDYCDDLIWLEDGRILEQGPAGRTVRAFLDHHRAGVLDALEYGSDKQIYEKARAKEIPDSPLHIGSIRFLDDAGGEPDCFEAGQPITLTVGLEAARPLSGLDLTALLVREDQMTIAELSAARMGKLLDIPAGRSEALLRLAPPVLIEDALSATVVIAEDARRERYLASALRQGMLHIRSAAQAEAGSVIEHPHRWVEIPGTGKAER